MVKAGGRSKWNKAKGSDGSSASSTSSTASPSSPTRRLKKGGKRGRRLCHKDGCTLCPSFGYEGDVAVSCSHHKEEGMRNLTARRCQHEGCFTVANFGMPGDKPGFCAAHSTEGMVNRNKPRGGEGMLLTVARSSRRTAKASNGVNGNGANGNGSGMLEAAAAAVAAASEGSSGARNRPASGGKDLLMRAATARSGGVGGGGAGFGINGGDCYGPLSSALTSARPRGSGDSASTVGAVASVVNGSPMSSMTLTSRGGRSNGVMSHKRSLSSLSMPIPMPPSESGSGSGSSRITPSAFVSRGDGLDGVSVGESPHKLIGSEEKPRGGTVGVTRGGDGGRVRSRNGGNDLGSTTVPRAFIVAPRGETDDFQKRFPSNGGGVLGGVPNGRGVGKMPFDLSFAGDFRTSGAIMDGGAPSFLMDGVSCLDNGHVVDSDLGLEIGATLDDILGVEQDDVETEVFDSKGGHEQEPFLGRCSDPSATAHSGLRSSANVGAMRSAAGLSLNGLSPTADSVIGVGGVGSGSNCGANGVGGMDFEIDHLPELNSVDLSGLHTGGDSGRDTRQQQQGHYRCAGASNSGNGSGGLRISSGIGDMSSASLTPSSSSVMATGIASGSPVAAAVRSTPTPATPTPATPQATPSAPGTPVAPDALVSPKPPGEEAWWDVLDGEDFVAMPEPMWGPTAEVQRLPSADDVIRDSTSHDHDSLVGVEASRRGAVGGNGVVHGISTGGGFYFIPGGGSGGNGGVGGGGASLSPPKKRHHGSLGDNQHASLSTHLGSTPSGNRSAKRSDIGSALSGKFFSSSGLQHSMASSAPLPAGFGLTVVPSSGISSNGSSSSMTMANPLTPASQLQTNMGVGVGIGGGMLRASPGVMGISQQGGGGNMGLGNRTWANSAGDAWLNGDAISPSKRMSLSPNKFASVSPSSSARPLLAQSTPPWAAGALCSHQQTQAAGRA